jgi:hypothetical protein
MRPYFERMPQFGKPLKENRIARAQESRAKLEAVEAEIARRPARREVGSSAEINKRRAHRLAAPRVPRRSRKLASAAQPIQPDG